MANSATESTFKKVNFLIISVLLTIAPAVFIINLTHNLELTGYLLIWGLTVVFFLIVLWTLFAFDLQYKSKTEKKMHEDRGSWENEVIALFREELMHDQLFHLYKEFSEIEEMASKFEKESDIKKQSSIAESLTKKFKAKKTVVEKINLKFTEVEAIAELVMAAAEKLKEQKSLKEKEKENKAVEKKSGETDETRTQI